MKELECQWDGRKSFYSKAMYEEKRGITSLYSYGVKIISIKGDKVKNFGTDTRKRHKGTSTSFYINNSEKTFQKKSI